MGTNAKFRDLAIRTLIGEAARDDPASMISVAHVIKNRADSGAYGDAAQGGGGRTILAPKQFSMWSPDTSSFGKTISPDDPRYQRAGQIVDGVFNGQIPDNTGGADHYYAPGGMPGGRAPSWVIGRTPTATIGGQHFYKLGLGASDATNFGHTSAPAIGATSNTEPGQGPGHFEFLPDEAHSPHWVPDADVAGSRQYLASLSVHTDRAGDTANLNPEFAVKMATAIQQARAAGLPVSVMSAFREPGQTGSAYDAGGNSSHSYGLAVDIAGLDGPNGKITNQWAKIAQANGLSNPYGAGNTKEFNHWQLPAAPLEQTPQLLAALKAAKATGDWQNVWNTYSQGQGQGQPGAPSGQGGVGSDARMPLGTAPAGTPPAVSTVVPNPANVPAPNVQPVSATAPARASPAPGSDKYSVLQGMTSGTGRNPMLYTAANFGNLFGGSAPSAPPAATPAAATAPSAQPGSVPDTAQRVPLANTPLPPSRPADAAPAAVPINANNPLPWLGPSQGPNQPHYGPWHAGGSPTNPIIDAPPPVLPSVSSNWGAANPINPDTLPNTGGIPGAGVTGRSPMTQGAPSMGFPAMTNPFGQPPPGQQLSQLPGSMFASAQNLIKYLFPSATG